MPKQTHKHQSRWFGTGMLTASAAIAWALMYVALPSLKGMVAPAFPDIPVNHPAAAAIAYVNDNGLMTGYDDGRFGPDEFLRRVELSKIAVVASTEAGIIDGCTERAFPDLDPAAWYLKYVCAARRQGYVSGYPDGNFRPAQYITAGEISKIFAIMFRLPLEPAPAAPDLWFVPYMNAMIAADAIPPTVQSIAKNVTRGETAQMLQALILHLQESADDSGSAHQAPGTPAQDPGADPAQNAMQQAAQEARRKLLEQIKRLQNSSHQYMRPTESWGSSAGQTQTFSAPQQGQQSSAVQGQSSAAQVQNSSTQQQSSAGSSAQSAVSSQQSSAPASGRSSVPASSARSSSGMMGQCTVQYQQTIAPYMDGLAVSGNGSHVAFVAEGSGQPYYNTGPELKRQLFLYDIDADRLEALTNEYLSHRSTVPRAAVTPLLNNDGSIVSMQMISHSGWKLAAFLNRATGLYQRIGEDTPGGMYMSADGNVIAMNIRSCVITYDRRTNDFTNVVGSSSNCMYYVGNGQQRFAQESWNPKYQATPSRFTMSGDGRKVAVLTLVYGQGSYEIHLVDVVSGQEKLLVAGLGAGHSLFLSHDGSVLLYNKITGTNESTWTLHETATGTETTLTENGAPVTAPTIIVEDMSDDTKSFVFRGNRGIYHYNRDSGVRTTIASDPSGFDHYISALSRDGNTVAWRNRIGETFYWKVGGRTGAMKTTYECPIDPAWL